MRGLCLLALVASLSSPGIFVAAGIGGVGSYPGGRRIPGSPSNSVPQPLDKCVGNEVLARTHSCCARCISRTLCIMMMLLPEVLCGRQVLPLYCVRRGEAILSLRFSFLLHMHRLLWPARPHCALPFFCSSAKAREFYEREKTRVERQASWR